MRTKAGYTIGDMELAQGKSAGEWVDAKIHEIFLTLAHMVSDEVFELNHPAPLIRGEIAMTNAWNRYLAHLQETQDDDVD